ncbi:sugar kinase [Actinocatenispora rupis]|uniref:Ribokinase n=1 Tax=Actinocatenispora rupis TaxID=519421 RepID=A0A8J3NEN9_9ACTN|nr:sugar kinase [Actinocatenispora rupis]GID14272.1 ribokinase [Actinocatenispora rupis]
MSVGVPESAELVTLGETMALLAAPQIGLLRHMHSLNLSIAGAESNLAIGVRRLGRTSAWLSRVGDDEFGRLVTGTIRSEGVDVRAAVDSSAPTGLMVKERRSDAITRVQYYRAGSAASRLSPSDVDEDLVRAARVLHVSGITPALSATARDAVRAAVDTARQAGVLVSLDFNYRSRLWDADAAGAELGELAARADIVFATVPEARLVVAGDDESELAAALAKLGPRHVLVKRGSRGSYALLDGAAHDAAPQRVPVVDPVGAGDAFASAYLAELIGGRPADECLAAASAAGAFAVTVPGDWEGLPSREELHLLGADPDDDIHR